MSNLKHILVPFFLLLLFWTLKFQGNDGDVNLNILVPLFVYPSWWESAFSWQQVADAGPKVTVVAVINQGNGPLPKPSTDYSKAMSILNSAGVYQIGYVNTNFTKKTLDKAKDDIDVWFSQNPQITGIYFDQVSTDKANMNYYTELFNYVRNKRFSNRVILNVGAAAPIELFNFADIIVIYHGEEKNIRVLPIASNIKELLPAKKAIFVMSCSQPRLSSVVEYAKTNRISWVFVSNERPGNFTKIPAFWSNLVDAVIEN